MIEDRNEKDDVQFDEAHLREMLEAHNIDAFRDEFLELHPYDQATFYEKVEPDIRKIIYSFLSPTEMADIFEAIDIEDDEYKAYLAEMDPSYGA